MRYIGIEQQPAIQQVNHVQSFIIAALAVIADRKQVCFSQGAFIHQVLVTFICFKKYFPVKAKLSQAYQIVD